MLSSQRYTSLTFYAVTLTRPPSKFTRRSPTPLRERSAHRAVRALRSQHKPLRGSRHRVGPSCT
eukprot:4238321-Pleurochrysis_carterae.AAC.1